MGVINQLDIQVANLIAAGEVVDRPASACKELLENAIDAGATKVTLEIKNGGSSLIRVSDNGCGMSRDDLPLSIKRHATSKIKNAGDLAAIMTLGFRGEALAAIASVSHLRILSKRREDEYGALLDSEPGKEPVLSDAAISDGTTILVEDLFANVPARRKFLKKDQTEAMAVAATLEKVALSYPSIAIKLIIDGQPRFETAGDGKLKNTIYALYGREFASRLIELGRDADGISIDGYIGTPENVRANRNYQNVFINGRFVKSKCAQAALEQAFTSYIPSDKFPACVMNIGLSPELVDVNIHPSKLEVKFTNERSVFEAVYYAVRGALEKRIPRPQLNFPGKDASEFSYEVMKTLNAFVPIEERSSRQQKCVYLNQKNVKEGQLSIEEQLTPSKSQSSPTASLRTDFLPDAGYADTVQAELSQADSISASGYQSSVQNEPPRTTAAPTAGYQSPAQDEPPSTTAAPAAGYQSSAQDEPPRTTTAPTAGYHSTTRSAYPQADTSADAPVYTQIDELPPVIEAMRSKPEADSYAELDLRDTPDAPSQRKSPPPYRIIGEAFYSFVFIEVADKVMIIDKHAAHERIIFEELKENLRTKSVVSQILLVPLELNLTPVELAALDEYSAEVKGIGFDYTTNGVNMASINAIPSQIEVSAAGDMLVTVADRLSGGTGSAGISRELLFERALYQASCKAAIKIGHIEDKEHIKWICDKLLMLDDIKYCPHGRPVAFELSKQNIELQFKRT
ncbi:MAG TPA: DNA mismatch repair endonuclease MutL [Firmicutes bacterium]|nr:DNA mismatch repair endonuclease MutL [Bacillota bacterium]